MPTCLTIDDLLQAARECSRGVRWKASVASWTHPRSLFANCLRLWRELDAGTYRPSEYTVFRITSPKPRVIRSPKFRDRVVQRAMCNRGLYRDLTRFNIHDNAACQLGKGTSFALDRLSRLLREHWRRHGADGWVLRIDIHKFFDSIPHAPLRAMVARQVRNPEFARLANQVIDTFDDPGIGLGSQLSQLLAIAYLSPIDHFAKERLRVRCYVRYSDDIVMVHPDREFLRAALAAIRERLAALGLSLNPKTAIHPLRQGVRYLKFRFRLTDTGRVLRTIDPASAARVRRRIRRMRRLGRTPEQIRRSFLSWRAHALRGNNANTIRRLQQCLEP